MRVCLLFNPQAGSSSQIATAWAILEKHHTVTSIETHSPDELRQKAIEAASGRFDVLAIAGGDGTIHLVVNALGEKFPEIRLAILPLGTGNDFCRTLAIPLDPVSAAQVVRRHHGRRIDLIRMEGDVSGYLVNAATGGFSGRVAADVTTERKQFWGPFAYLRGAAGPIAELTTQRVSIRFDDAEPEEFEVLNLVVANGRTAAGGFAIAPLANPEDGFLDVVIVSGRDVLDLSVIAASLMAGDYLREEFVTHRRAKRVEIVSESPIPFSLDGEQIELQRVTFTVVHKCLRVLPGPEYRPDPRGKPVGGHGLSRWFFAAIAGAMWLTTHTLRQPRFVLAFVALMLFAVLTRGVIYGHWDHTNQDVSALVSEFRSPRMDQFAIGITKLGDPFTATMIGFTIAFAFRMVRRTVDAIGLVAVIVAIIASELILKPTFAVPRPVFGETSILVSGYGFPSGHALRSMALAAYVVLAGWGHSPRSRWRIVGSIVAVLLASGVVASRVYLGVHSFTDVIGGMLVALFWVGIATGCVARWSANRS